MSFGSQSLTIQRNPDLPTILRLKLLPINFHRRPMRNQQIMPYSPALPRAISHLALRPITRMPRRKQPRIIPQNRRAPRLIERDPVLHFGQCLKQHSRVVRIIRHKLFFVQETAIAGVEAFGEVPMEEGDEGDDAFGEEVVDELGVEGDAGRVNWIVASADGNNAGPGDGEAVGFSAGLLQESNILVGSVVGIASYGARGAISNFSGDGAEFVPDGRATTICSRCSFYLVAERKLAMI